MGPQERLPQVPFIGWGTAGRDVDNAGNYFTLGDGSDSESGLTTVHVQLFSGRDPTVTLDASRGQGRYVLCQLAWNVMTIPPFGSRVMIMSPNAHGTLPGNSIIIAVVDKRARSIFGALKGGEMVLSPLLGGSTLVGRDDGTFEMGKPAPSDFAGLASKIDSAVSDIINAFNAHTHPIPALAVTNATPLGPGPVTTTPDVSAVPDSPIAPEPTVASKILKLSG